MDPGSVVPSLPPLILNDYADARDGKQGPRQGHVPPTSLPVAPFFFRGRITAVANREKDGSREDFVQPTSILDGIEAATVRGRAEGAPRRRDCRAGAVSRKGRSGRRPRRRRLEPVAFVT